MTLALLARPVQLAGVNIRRLLSTRADSSRLCSCVNYSPDSARKGGPLTSDTIAAAAQGDGEGVLKALRATNLHLQSTIDTMRARLEQADRDAESEVARTRSDMSGELSVLQSTIDTMRRKLEQQASDADARVQGARAVAQAEIDQLRGTIDALRITVDRERTASEQALAALEATRNREKMILQQQIQALRERLEETV